MSFTSTAALGDLGESLLLFSIGAPNQFPHAFAKSRAATLALRFLAFFV